MLNKVYTYLDKKTGKHHFNRDGDETRVKTLIKPTGKQGMHHKPLQEMPPNLPNIINVARSNKVQKYGGAKGLHIYNYSNVSISWEDFIAGLSTYAYLPIILDEERRDIGELTSGWKMNTPTMGYSNIVAFDVDNNTTDGSQISIKDFIYRFRFKYVLVTTKSHGKKKANGKDRYRVWIPVQKNILYMPPDEYARTLTRLASYIGLTTQDDKLDNRAVVMGSYQPKFEPSPEDAYIYVSKYDKVIDFDIERGKNRSNIWEELPEVENTLFHTSGDVEKDYNILLPNGDVQPLSTFSEDTKCFCPICEDEDSKTPSAMVYAGRNTDDAGQPNSVYCYKNPKHQRFVTYKGNSIKTNNEGFKDESRTRS